MKLCLVAFALSLSFACGGSSAPPPAEPVPVPADPVAADPVAAEPVAAEPAADDSAPTSDHGSMTDDEIGAAAIAMMEAMAQGAKDNEGDCDAQADSLQAIVDDNAELMATLKEYDKDPAKKQAFEEKYQQQAVAIMGGMMGSLMPCGDNAKLQRVFESFE